MGQKVVKRKENSSSSTPQVPTKTVTPEAPKLSVTSELLTDADVAWLCSQSAFARRESSEPTWKLLFSSSKNGRSFQALRFAVMAEGPNVVVARDVGGASFGAIVGTWLDRKPIFYGEGGAVFKLGEHRGVWENNRGEPCQYLDWGSGCQYSGLAVGGRIVDRWFAFSIDESMDGGVSCGPVATFCGSPSLSSSQGSKWALDVVEVWKIADPPEPKSQELRKLIHHKEKLKGTGALLESQAAKEAMEDLKMAGHTFYSQELPPAKISGDL